MFKVGVLYPVSGDNTKGHPRCIKCLKTNPNGGMRPVNKYDNLMHEDVNGNLFSIQATTFMMLETKTSSIRSDQSVLDLLQYIKEYDTSVGCVSRIVLGQAESQTKQTTGKRKKLKPTDNNSVNSIK